MAASMNHLMYAALVWTERAGQFKCNLKEMARAQRLVAL